MILVLLEITLQTCSNSHIKVKEDIQFIFLNLLSRSWITGFIFILRHKGGSVSRIFLDLRYGNWLKRRKIPKPQNLQVF